MEEYTENVIYEDDRPSPEMIDWIDRRLMAYEKADAADMEPLYQFVEEFAQTHHLPNTLKALPLVRSLMVPPADQPVEYLKDADKHLAYYRHSLMVGRMLIDLEAPITPEEMDISLAAGLCHVLKELYPFPKEGEELTSVYHLDPGVYEVIKLITRHDPLNEVEQEKFYDRIKRNKLALLVRLADRGNLVEQLYGISIWESREYVRETRTYFFPMCTYAKEHYPELYEIVGVLMEKMKCLIDVTDILSSRYQQREIALTTEITTYREENTRLRRMIERLKAE